MKRLSISFAEFKRTRNVIFSEQPNLSDGSTACSNFAEWIDHILSAYFKQYFYDLQIPVALFALGGYGRAELNPYSDIDILLIYSGKSINAQKETKVFIQALWDIGLDVGHQFVTSKQCCELVLEDAATRTSILEMRFVCGEKLLISQIEETLNHGVFKKEQKKFTDQILDDTSERHKKFGLSPQLLEPHIKEGVGGLRDLHVLLWLFRVNHDWQQKYVIKKDQNNSIINFVNNLRDNSLILKADAEKLEKAYKFLLKVRNLLHLSAERKNDLLEYGIQKKVASELGYQNREQWLAVENFMRDYYTHSRRIYHTYLILSEKLARRRKSPVIDKKDQDKIISDAFFLSQNEIHLNPSCQNIFQEKPETLMQVFVYRQQYGVRLSEALRESIYYANEDIDDTFRCDKKVIGFFLKLVKNPKHLADNLRTMHELHLLDTFLPEFSRLTSLAQYDLYHYYSVDEHTLVAIDNLIKLEEYSESENNLTEIYHQIKDKKIIILAILFHDLGKAKKGDHNLVGADIADKILTRWQVTGEAKTRILFLVRNHQKMEQVAFRRNIEEFGTILEFKKIVQDEENLKLLYLLSYADLSAVNPNIWTSWKGILLMELFKATQNYLHGKKQEIMFDAQAFNQLAIRVQKELKVSLSKSEIKKHLEMMPPHYLDSFDEYQIAEHLNYIDRLSNLSNVMGFEDDSSHFVITAVTRDQPFCLVDICGVLSVHDMNIFSARIFTRRDKIVIDVFRVIPVSANLRFNDIPKEDISADLDKILSGNMDLPALFIRHKRRWKRRKFRKTGYPDEITFDNRQSSPYTIIDVFTDDSVGLLYRLALAMSEMKLNILSAKIATRVDQVADSFYVVDDHNQKITDENKQKKISRHLLKAIHREF